MSILKFPHFLWIVFLTLNLSAQNTTAAKVSMDPEKSIIRNAKDSGNHDFLLAAVKVSNLETILDTSGPFTVFAPSDISFDSGTREKVSELVRGKNKEELQSLIGYHIIAGNLSASKILISS